MREIRPETVPRLIWITESPSGWLLVINGIPILLMDEYELTQLWEASDYAMKDVNA